MTTKLKVYKTAPLALMALLALTTPGLAQEISLSDGSAVVRVKVKGFDKKLQKKIVAFGKNLEANLNELGSNLSVELDNITPEINADLKDLGKSLDLDLDFSSKNDSNDKDGDNGTDNNTENNGQGEKFKSYSKSYPIDGNDKIKLSNQYGRITINTWDRNEVKVDVQIKAQASDDNAAQKLLDGVQIRDGKEGDLVFFRTNIEPGSNGNNSWNPLNWGSSNKKRKLEINYTVYMPSKTDLNVEDSYGGIVLPDLQGKIRISSSYGSVQAQDLTNPANEISGSYGSLKAGSINGTRLDYSYGSVEVEECNNLKADLSYGSFKLGKLKGAADFDLSYVSGFKIEELGAAVKRVNVNSSYSNVGLGIPGNNSFDFDVTTTYGGFNYDDDKATITSKSPSDSKHYSATKNYKGYYGKSGSGAQINIHSTYGGVRFD